MVLKVRVESADARSVKSDLLVVNLFKDVKRPKGATGAVDAATGGIVSRVVATGDFTGKLKETTVLYTDGAPMRRVLVVGLGEKDELDLDRVRQVGARLAKTARDLHVRRVHTILHGAGIGGLDPEEAARALVEGAVLALYKFERYKSKKSEADEPEKRLDELVIVADDADVVKAARRGAAAGVAVAESVNLARDWATTSGEDAHAENLAKDVQRMARSVGLKCRVLDERRIRDLGMGGVLAVNRGSTHEPRFVVLEHGSRHKKNGTVVLVGKGITFDSGGISIKPAERMDEMKFDKAGAAAVWGALRAAALLDVEVHVVGLTPLAENMPSGDAMKPGDVFTGFGGKTFEILNTDAEGRLVLADAVAYAGEFDPDAIVDIATLTGHVVVAFGAFCSGAMGNDPALMARLKSAADRAHERVAELPFFEEYAELLKGGVADVKNHGGRPAGAITAGKFIEAFLPGKVPWVHMDIAGTGWHDGRALFNPEYSPGKVTGVGVRTFVELLRGWEGPLRERPTKGSPTTRTAKGARKGSAKRSASRARR